MNKKSLTAAGPVPACQAKKRGRTRSNTKNPGPAVGGKVSLYDYSPWVELAYIHFYKKVPEGFIIESDDAKAQFDDAEGKNSVTWIGHMSTVICLDGKMTLVAMSERIGMTVS